MVSALRLLLAALQQHPTPARSKDRVVSDRAHEAPALGIDDLSWSSLLRMRRC